MRVWEESHAFVTEDIDQCAGYICVFALEHAGPALHDADGSPEAAEYLCEFQADVAAAEDHQMSWYGIEVQQLDMGKWVCGFEAADSQVEIGAGSRAENDVVGG